MVSLLNRTVSFFVSLSILVACLIVNVSGAELSVSADSAILMCADTGEIIYEKNAYEKRGIASTTKIMTALLAFEKGNVNKTVIAEKDDVTVEGTSMGLKAGDKVTVSTLVSGMLLESGNDGANVTATAIGGNREKFIRMMNDKAKILNMKNTSFKNPSGLTEEGHYSTAYDMALLASYAVQNEEFCNICSLKSIRVFYGGPDYYRTFYNHNKLLGKVDGVFGVKTGFTKASGRCLVSAAKRGDVTLVAVTLKAPDDWRDHEKLLEYGFSVVEQKEIKLKDTVKISVVGSHSSYINAVAKEPLKVYTYSSNAKIKIEIYCEKFLYSGVKKGDTVGFVRALGYMDKVLCEVELESISDAHISFSPVEKPITIKDKIIKFLEGKSD